MKAITYSSFGTPDVLMLDDIAAPNVKDNGVLVSMRASSVNVIDSRIRNGLMSPLVNKKFPKMPGADVAGVVTAVGSQVTRFKAGDAVFGGVDALKGGAFAEVVAVPETGLALMPASLGFSEAAALPTTGLAALYALRELGKVQRGSRVLIYGSSGSAGLFAIQLAKHFGANVTTVSGSKGASASREMGADTVIDYKAGSVTFNGLFDIIIDFSSTFGFVVARRYLKPDGRFVEASPNIPKFIGSMLANPFRAQKHLTLQTVPQAKDLAFLASLVDAGHLKVTIANTYPLASARQAFVEQEKGGVVGKIVITGDWV